MNIDNLTLFAGDTWSWTEELPDYSPADYTAKVVLKLNGANPVIIAASIENDVFNFNFPSTNTSGLPAGIYFYQYIASKDGSDHYSASGYVEVRGNILTAATDMRGRWQQIYDNLLNIYSTMIAEGKVEISVTMNGRSVTYNRENLIKEIQNAGMKANEERGEGGFLSFNITFQRR
jgi:hypothetical protein